jgi:predicted DNA-binding transcriptional regulator YafY
MKLVTRFPYLRLGLIDRALRAGEYPNAATIARQAEVCRRTAQRDFETLRDRFGAPLAFDHARNGYYYTEPGFRLPAVGLTEGELVAICLGASALGQYRGTPYAATLRRALDKVLVALADVVSVDLDQLARAVSFRSSAACDVAPETFGRLVAAIRARRTLRIRYHAASSDKVSVREVDPYHLACVDGAWYLVAHCHSRRDRRMFAPGRVLDLEETGRSFERAPDFDADAYLGGAFAVLRADGDERHRVRLRFTGPAVRYVAERTWHASQAREDGPDGSLTLSFELGHLREVERWALSWGADCEVLAPPELRLRMAETAARSLALHRGGSVGPKKGRQRKDRKRGV